VPIAAICEEMRRIFCRSRWRTWPGNVREPRNEAGTIDLDQPFVQAKEALVAAFELRYLTELMRVAIGNVAEASRRSRLNRRYLYDLLKKHALI